MLKKIKTVTITQYDYIIRNFQDEELDIHGHPHHFNEFNEAGQPLREIKYDRQGGFEEMFTYEYNEKGFLVKETYYPEEEMAAEDTTFEENEMGLPGKSIKHYLDGSVDTTTFFYDEQQRLIRKVTTSEDEEPEEETFEYEEVADVVQESEVEENANHRITRNEKGQVVLEEIYSDEEELVTKIERKFNEEGNPMEVEIYIDGQGKTLTRHYYLQYEYSYFSD